MDYTFFKTLETVEKGARVMAKEIFSQVINDKGHLDNNNCLYVSSGEMSDESLYINGDFDPIFEDDIEQEVNYVEELGSIGFDKDGNIYVSTDMGIYNIDQLSFSDIMLLAEYVGYLYLEDK